MVECRICIDWQSSYDILGTVRAEVAIESYMSIIKDAINSSAIITEKLIIIKVRQEECMDLANKIIMKISDINSRRLVRIPLKGCVICPTGTKLQYGHVLNLLKTYSSAPTVAVIEENEHSSYRILAPKIECGMYPVSTKFIVTSRRFDRDEEASFTSHENYPSKTIIGLLEEGKCVCVCSVYKAAHLELFSSLCDFAIAMKRLLVITPDLSKHFMDKRLQELTFQGQVYLSKTSPSSDREVNLTLPIPEGYPAQSFMKPK